MSKLKVEQIVVGSVMTNCYFVQNKETKEILVIDPGASADMLTDRIRQEGLKPVAVLLTHGHFDHAAGAAQISKEFGILVYAHEEEKQTLETPGINLSGMMGKEEKYHADCYVKNGERLELIGFSIQVLFTPGHTAGGACYYIEDEQAVFAGDTLFCQSVGRTDFPTGSASVLIRSIKEKLMGLPDSVTVYPGHNEITTIGQERKYNPFL